jgi:hypothetical protein
VVATPDPLVELYEENAEYCLRSHPELRSTASVDLRRRNLSRRKDEGASLVLAELYEQHAEECLRRAAKMDDPKRCDLLLKLAMQWRKDAEALRQSTPPKKDDRTQRRRNRPP